MYIHDWSGNELEQPLYQCLGCSTHLFCLLLDGLDEFDQREEPFDLIELINRIRAKVNTKVYLASQPEHIYIKEYRAFPQIKLQDLTRSDIYNYANNQLKKYTPSIQLDREKRIEELVEYIVWKSEGVFLWVYLVLNSLRWGISMGGG